MPITAPATHWQRAHLVVLSDLPSEENEIRRDKQVGPGLKAGNREGRGATPWRRLPCKLFGSFINIIVCEPVCFIVTCSILLYPVFLEKWITLSLFTQDNKTKRKKAWEQYWSDGGHPDCKRKHPWVNILRERQPFTTHTHTRNIPRGFDEHSHAKGTA